MRISLHAGRAARRRPSSKRLPPRPRGCRRCRSAWRPGRPSRVPRRSRQARACVCRLCSRTCILPDMSALVFAALDAADQCHFSCSVPLFCERGSLGSSRTQRTLKCVFITVLGAQCKVSGTSIHYGTAVCLLQMLPAGPRPVACLPPLLMCLAAPLDAFQNCQAQGQAWRPDGRAECLQITQHKHARGRRPVRRVENRHTGSTLSAASAALVLLACRTAAWAGCRHCRHAHRPNHHTTCTHWHTNFITLCSQAVPDAQSPGAPCGLQAPQALLRLARSLILSPHTLPVPSSYMFTGARAQHAARHAHESEGVGQITNSLQANVLDKCLGARR